MRDNVAEAQRVVLIVDDDDRFRTRLTRAFRDRGYKTLDAPGIEEARCLLTDHSVSHAVIDLRLADRSGLDVVRQARSKSAEMKIVVLTGYGSIATALEAMNLGATHYLTKPADVDDIEGSFGGPPPTGEEEPRSHPDVPSLARVEWEHINRVLVDCGGNVSEAARRLGLHRRSLQRKLAKFPVSK